MTIDHYEQIEVNNTLYQIDFTVSAEIVGDKLVNIEILSIFDSSVKIGNVWRPMDLTKLLRFQLLSKLYTKYHKDSTGLYNEFIEALTP